MYQSAEGNFTLALAGDFMMTQRVSVHAEPRFLALVQLMREADATLVNLETCVRTWDEGTPTITSGTPMTTAPHLLDELKWFGVDIVTCANNHAFDYGEGGIVATLRHLDAAGIPHAGIGRNLAEARMPAYVETRGGRLGMVAATSAFRVWNRAGPQRAELHGRPGVSPLSFKTSYSVDEAVFAALKQMNVELGFQKADERNRKHFYSDKEVGEARDEELRVFGQRVVKGNSFAISTEADSEDVDDMLRWVRETRRQADWVAVSFHCHEFNGKSVKEARSKVDLAEMADFFGVVSRAAIDAGADVVAGHGSHTPLGIEIYKGKPIFYSLGTFMFHNETVPIVPGDAYERFDLGPDATPADFYDVRTNKDKKGFPAYQGYWESFVAVCEFAAGHLARIRLHPIVEGYKAPRSQRGRPMLAEGEDAARVLARVQELSQPYGTAIRTEGTTGIIDIA